MDALWLVLCSLRFELLSLIALLSLSRSAAMKKRITNAKIACLDMNLQKQRMNLGVHVTIDDPEQLEAIRKRLVSGHRTGYQGPSDD